MNWSVAQLGAREHYAIPRVLHKSDRLLAAYTEYWGNRGRWHPDLANGPIKSWNTQFLLHQVRRRVLKIQPTRDRYHEFVDTGKWFGRLVAKEISKMPKSLERSAFFSYDTTALEPMQAAKAKGQFTAVGQMDPGSVEFEIVQAEEAKHSNWVRHPIIIPSAYQERRQEEWAVADKVIVNSDWSKRALEQQGVPPEKILVIPLAYEVENSAIPTSSRNEAPEVWSASRPLKVLFLGQVILRKGIVSLVEAAGILEKQKAPVSFEVVGPLGINPEAIKDASTNIQFYGKCDRQMVAEHYQTANLFILPTLSDGFAITQLEAMANGLPVIATDRCGAVVQDGEDGTLIRAGSAASIVEAIERYLEEPALVRDQSHQAKKRAQDFSLAQLEKNWSDLEKGLMQDAV